MRKLLAFWLLTAAIFAASASAQTTKSDAGLPVTLAVSKLQMDKPVRGKMMFTITYKNTSSKAYDVAFSVGAESDDHETIFLTIPGFRNVKPDSNGAYFLKVLKFPAGAARVIHVSMPKQYKICYGVQLHVLIRPHVVKSSKHQIIGC